MAKDRAPIEIMGDLTLGSYAAALGDLGRLATERPTDQARRSRLEVHWSSKWLDPSLLSMFAQFLRLSQNRFSHVTLRLGDAVEDKIPFLWECGFWPLVQANYKAGCLACIPDPWRARPTSGRAAASFTPLFTVENPETDTQSGQYQAIEKRIGDIVTDWDGHLRRTACFPVVENADVMQSREYLFLLLWELAHNAHVHSGSQLITLMGQIFVSQSDSKAYEATCLQQGSPSPSVERELALFKSLEWQYSQQQESTILPARKKWLRHHEEHSFMLLSCADCGIGIPESLRRYAQRSDDGNDVEDMRRAFSPWTSTRRNNPEFYDVHGLSQIRRVIDDYDGYLFTQSGRAYVEITRGTGDLEANQLLPEQVLSGTLFQALLPLSSTPAERSARLWLMPGRSAEAPPSVGPERRAVLVAGELARAGIQLPVEERRWHDAVGVVIAAADEITADPLFLDLTQVPFDRQFLSVLLRTVRTTTGSHGILVVNAPPAFLGSIHRMQRLDLGDITDADVKMCSELDLDLAQALSRNQIGSLPLLLPFVALGKDGKPQGVKWLGLGSYGPGVRRTLERALSRLLRLDGEEIAAAELLGCSRSFSITKESLEDMKAEGVPSSLTDKLAPLIGRVYETRADLEKEIADLVPRKTCLGYTETIVEHAAMSGRSFDAILRSIVRCNGSLFEAGKSDYRCLLRVYDLHHASRASLEQELKSFVEEMRHRKDDGQQKYVYSLSWHEPKDRFRQRYYRTWNVLVDPHRRNVAARLLVLKAFEAIGPQVGAVKAIVSATPSAGLLAREVAAVLDLPFWEVASIHEMDHDWFPELGGHVIVVHDVLDTGRLTCALVEHLVKAGSDVLCVMTMLDNTEAEPSRPANLPEIISGAAVSLGTPSPSDIRRARRTGDYFEVDPHTLEPVSPAGSIQKLESPELETLVRSGSICSGHLIQGQHHYELYFSLPDALACYEARELIVGWVLTMIRDFARRKKAETVTVVYPYYSPIYSLVSRLRTRWNEAGGNVRLQYVLGRPRQLTGRRVGYELVELPGGLEDDLEFSVFLDDGIASGGTFAAIVDELVARNCRALRALVLFDRIGSQPRRHLRNIERYRTRKKGMTFEFRTLVSTSLRCHFDEDCPECKTLRDVVTPCLDGPGFLSACVRELEGLLEKTIVGSRPVAESSRLRPEDLLSVLQFRHVALSDTPSPQQVERSLAGRGGTARLECLSTVLSDPKLFHQLVDRNQCEEWIQQDLADPAVSADVRARFILKLGLCTDSVYAHRILTQVLPHSYSLLAARPETGAEGSLNRYFDTHQLEFLALSAAICSLCLSRARRDKLPPWEAWLTDWMDALGTRSPDDGVVSLYAFHLRSVLPLPEGQILPAREALYLIANFAGRCSHHSEGLLTRLRRFRLAANERRPDWACEAMPPEQMRVLVDQVARTQEHFQAWVFTDDQLKELTCACDLWHGAQRPGVCPAGASQDLTGLLQCVSGHFLREAPPATVFELIACLAPRVDYLLGLALSDWDARGRSVKIVTNLQRRHEEARVFGNRDYLRQVVGNLLNNAYEAWEATQAARTSTREREPTIAIAVRPGPASGLVIEVKDNVPYEAKDSARYFRLGSALNIHQYQIRQWEGDLDLGEHGAEGKSMLLTLKTVDVDRSQEPLLRGTEL